MKQISTLYLKVIVVLISLVVLLLSIFLLPKGLMTDTTGLFRPLIIGMYLTTGPFFIGVYHILKLLNNINSNKAFSLDSVKSLNIIKFCALSIGVLYAIGLPYIFLLAQADDAPGLVLIGIIFTFASLAIAVFAGVFQKLIKGAMDIKSVNDLTV